MPQRLFLVAAALFFLSCRADSVTENANVLFDEQAVYQCLLAQCQLGPRVPNTEAHQQALAMFVHHFDSLGAVVEKQSFRVKDPYSTDTLRLTNLIVKFNAQKRNRLLFCAHWDSRPRCEMDPDPTRRVLPLTGANDGASGVAVLMQLARHIVQTKAERGVDLLLLDGEDWGKSGDLDYYCLGSKEFARSVDASIYDYAIVLDMIGDKDQRFFKEGYSVRYQPKLAERIWERALQLGYADNFNPGNSEPIYDDHVPLLAASIRTIDIIDFDYPWWHTTSDTPDKCSPESLGRVGKVMLSLILDPL